MLASREGISFLWYDDSAKKWGVRNTRNGYASKFQVIDSGGSGSGMPFVTLYHRRH